MFQKRSVFWFCVLVFSVHFSYLPTTEAAEERILFVGNSYTFGNDLHEQARKLLKEGFHHWNPILTKMIAPGGYRFTQHLKDADGTNGDTELRKALVTGKGKENQWKYLIFQEQSQIPGIPSDEYYYQNSLAAFKKLHKLVIAKKLQTMLFMTWGRRKGDKDNKTIFPNYKKMQERLRLGYKMYADTASQPGHPVYTAPVGLAWEKVYDDLIAAKKKPTLAGTRFSKLYEADDSHPSAWGTYLAGCVFFASLTGHSPVGLTNIPKDQMPEADRKYFQQVAEQVVLYGAFKGFSLPWAFEWKDYKWPSKVSAKSISSFEEQPLVLIRDNIGKLQELRLGTLHDQKKKGNGRLWLRKTAQLQIQKLLIVGDSGSGELLIYSGKLETPLLKVAEKSNSKGLVWLKGGVLQAIQIKKGSGKAELRMESGRIESKEISVPFTQKAGTLSPGPSITKLLFYADYEMLEKASLEIEIKDPSKVAGVGYDQLESKQKVTLHGKVELALKVKIQKKVTLDIIKASQIVLGKNFQVEMAQKGWRTSHRIKKKAGKAILEITIFSNSSKPSEAKVEASKEQSHSENLQPDGSQTREAEVTKTESAVPFEQKTQENSNANTHEQMGADQPANPQGGCCSIGETPHSNLFLWLTLFSLFVAIWRNQQNQTSK